MALGESMNDLCFSLSISGRILERAQNEFEPYFSPRIFMKFSFDKFSLPKLLCVPYFPFPYLQLPT